MEKIDNGLDQNQVTSGLHGIMKEFALESIGVMFIGNNSKGLQRVMLQRVSITKGIGNKRYLLDKSAFL